jgi:ribonucleoside-diphosphate reductase alpha chain
MIWGIRKRDGSIAEYRPEKIAKALSKAFLAVGRTDESLSARLSKEAEKILADRFANDVPSVEDVQDIVEGVLISSGQADAAKAYIIYRERRSEIREAKKALGVVDDLKLSVNAISVLERRYLRKDEKLRVIETPGQLFRRVAHSVAAADAGYGKSPQEVAAVEAEFYSMLSSFLFLPNSPTLMNAGTSMGQLSACFVVPVEDSMESIFEAVKSMALIHQSGGGTGFSFSKLRPSGDVVKSTGGVASGPVSFMRVYDTATDVIKQGGKRRGANMGILRVDHPDILSFIRCKEKEGVFVNFNISVALTDQFMQAVKENRSYKLINPHSGRIVEELSAKMVFDFIADQAWKSGDPGIVFIDEMNRHNPTPSMGSFESTNPCGEQPLLPYESCNLGSVNLSRMVTDGKIDWEKLRDTVRKGVHFLDNVIDANKYPLALIEKNTLLNRKIGLGVMGYAEMLIQLGIPYDSEEGLATAEKVMAYVDSEAKEMSEELGVERGSFPNYGQSIWKGKYKAMRNATVTTIAPTGSISIIADCSSGIEPLFAVSFMRNVMGGVKLLETNKYFEEMAREEGFYSEEIMLQVAEKGSPKEILAIPDRVKRLFSTAHEINPQWHVRMQAAFQKYTDNAVSKTINLPHNATPKEIEDAYLLAYDLKCKGITVYRYGSKDEQVLYVGTSRDSEKKYTTAESDYSGGCAGGACPL